MMYDIWYLLVNIQFMDICHIVLINFIHLTDSSKWMLVHYIDENYSISLHQISGKVTFIVMATISCQAKKYWRKPRIFNICWLIYHLSDICSITKQLKMVKQNSAFWKVPFFLVLFLIATMIWEAMVRKQINRNHKNRVAK